MQQLMLAREARTATFCKDKLRQVAGGNWQLALRLLDHMEEEFGERSLNGQNACISACHVGNQWQWSLWLFSRMMKDRPLGGDVAGGPLQADAQHGDAQQRHECLRGRR